MIGVEELTGVDYESRHDYMRLASDEEHVETMALAYCVCPDEAPTNYEALQAAGIGKDHFSKSRTRLTWESIERVFENGHAISLETVGADLQERGEMQSELMDLLCNMVKSCPLSDKLACTAKHLMDLWTGRRLEVLQNELSDARQSTMPLSERNAAMAEISSRIGELTTVIEVAETRDPFDMADSEVSAAIDGTVPESANPIFTGIDVIDEVCGPLDVATGDYYAVLFAVSSCGKSSLATQIIGHNLALGKRCLVFLGETSSDLLVKQIAAQRSEIDLRNMRSELPKTLQDMKSRISRLREMHGNTFFTYDSSFDIETIVSKCRHVAKEIGDIDLVVVDHLHLLKTRKSFSDERLRFNHMSSEIKKLGLEINCPMLVLAQPNRSLKTEERAPRPSDLKETGNLEDDADRVWAIQIPSEAFDGSLQGETEYPDVRFHQLKFRRGHQTTTKLKFKKRWTKFFTHPDMQKNSDPQPVEETPELFDH